MLKYYVKSIWAFIKRKLAMGFKNLLNPLQISSPNDVTQLPCTPRAPQLSSVHFVDRSMLTCFFCGDSWTDCEETWTRWSSWYSSFLEVECTWIQHKHLELKQNNNANIHSCGFESGSGLFVSGCDE